MKAKRLPAPLAGVRPNEGLQAAYRAKLERMVDDLHASLLYWLRAAYRANTPEMAQDDLAFGSGESPAMAMRRAMQRLARRWQRRFDDGAPELAKWFSLAAMDRSDKQLAEILKRAGFSVRFRMTAAANDVMQATIGEQVGLIKSIAQQHLGEVEGLVMRSVSAGRDLGALSKEIEDRYGVTKRRAALISRDQNNKASASIQRVRQQGLGIRYAIWRHSNGGNTMRPSHVKASQDKVLYEVSKGWLDPATNKRIWPGTEINCKCFARPILPFMESDYADKIAAID